MGAGDQEEPPLLVLRSDLRAGADTGKRKGLKNAGHKAAGQQLPRSVAIFLSEYSGECPDLRSVWTPRWTLIPTSRQGP